MVSWHYGFSSAMIGAVVLMLVILVAGRSRLVSFWKIWWTSNNACACAILSGLHTRFRVRV